MNLGPAVYGHVSWFRMNGGIPFVEPVPPDCENTCCCWLEEKNRYTTPLEKNTALPSTAPRAACPSSSWHPRARVSSLDRLKYWSSRACVSSCASVNRCTAVGL